MGFLSRLGVGGPSVDLVLTNPYTTPGGQLTGTLDLTGGSSAQEIAGVSVMLEALVEVESGDHEWRENVRFAHQPLTGPFSLPANQQVTYPVSLQVPWEAPVTAFDGWHLRGMQVGVRTQVDIRGAVDSTDRDPIAIHPLPAQSAVLRALGNLGWRFHSADLEKGRLRGSALPFYQEISFMPTRHSRIRELEVTFIASERDIEIVLEADRRGSWVSAGGDAYARLQIPHNAVDENRLAAGLDAQIQRLDRRGGW